MADFRMKLFAFAGVATMFAGMANAQINNSGAATACTLASNPVFVAAEGTTEQVADTTISCPASTNATGGTMNITVYLSPSVTITSATLGTGSSAKSETLAGLGAQGAPYTVAPVNGTVTGSTVAFNNITVPAIAFTITITNIKINASQIATSSGAPTAVTETVFLGGTNVTPSVLGPTNVAFATNGLSSVSTTTSGPIGALPFNPTGSVSICSGVNAFTVASPSFVVNYSEGFATAFKTQGLNTTNANLGSEFSNNTYTGYGVTAPASNTANSGTIVQITLNNIPSGVTVYALLTVGNSGGVMTLVNGATGSSITALTGTTANGSPGATSNTAAGTGTTAAALTVTNGSATAFYEETTNAIGAVETYNVPFYLQAAGAAVAAPSGAITATVSFAPVGATTTPNFVSGSSTTTKNTVSFTACTTTLLFPYVTNSSGFETGIAISNTGADLLGTHNGSPSSSVTGASGTCLLTFFGSGVTAPAYTTPSVAPGTTWANTLSTTSGTSGATALSGYVIASCNFQYAHGYAFIEDGLGGPSGVAEGYLALVVVGNRSATENLNN
jgi:hypothetical protein